MKRYKLLKDLPFAKAGEIFDDQYEDGILTFYHQNRTIDIYKTDIENFEEWFEEVKEPKIFYTIDIFGFRVLEVEIDVYIKEIIENLKTQGLLFHTEEEAEKYLAYLKAKAIIKKDTKGFRPDWGNENEILFYGYWDLKGKISYSEVIAICKEPQIYFKSREDISESFEKHPEEWKIYLTYE